MFHNFLNSNTLPDNQDIVKIVSFFFSIIKII